MLAAIQSTGSFNPTPSVSQHTQSQNSPCGKDKPGAPHLVPMAAVPPPHFLISPGGGYTLLPSVTPINGCDTTFGGIASLHPLGQFTGNPRPFSAYYADLQQQTSQATGTSVISGVQNGGSNPQERKPIIAGPLSTSVTTSSNSTGPTVIAGPSRSPGHSTDPPISTTSATTIPTTPEDPDLGMDTSLSDIEREEKDTVEIKREPATDDSLQSCARRNSDSRVDESGALKNPYPISALIDIPTSLTRSSRTSSLSSSLSSFRFGGSMSTLWASQLSGKIPNMKSTG